MSTATATATLKATIDREKFLPAFAAAARVAPARSPKPVLCNVLLVAGDDGTVTLVATNMEMGLRIAAEGVSVQAPGKALLPVSTVLQFLSESTADELKLKADGSYLAISGTGGQTRLQQPDAGDYPEVDTSCQAGQVELSRYQLREAIRCTLFCCEQSLRFALGGLMFDIAEATIIGTDGRRLSAYKIPIEGKAPRTVGSVVPIDSCKALLGLLGDGEGKPVAYQVDVNKALFQFDGISFTARLVEGRFPKWQEVLPDFNQSYGTGSFPAGPMLRAVRQAAITTNDDSKAIRIHPSLGPGSVESDDVLQLHTAVNELGDSDAQAPVEKRNGDSINVSIDAVYFREFLSRLDPDEDVEYGFNGPEGAFLLSARSRQYRHVIMPLANS